MSAEFVVIVRRTIVLDSQELLDPAIAEIVALPDLQLFVKTKTVLGHQVLLVGVERPIFYVELVEQHIRPQSLHLI